MQGRQISSILQAFSAIETREARKFLLSPYVNTRQDLVQLYDFLVLNRTAAKEQVWQHLHPCEPYDDQKFRLLLSYLHRLLEQYLSFREATHDPLANRLYLAAGYRKRGVSTAFERTRSGLQKAMEAQPLRDGTFHLMNYRLHWEAYHTATAENPATTLPLPKMAHALDIFYLSTRLRLVCLAAAQMGVYHAGNQSFMEEEVVAMAQHPAWQEVPAVSVYLHCYRMLKQPQEETHFRQFTQLLRESATCFGAEEMRGLYLLAINYCIRRLNDGRRDYFREVFDLYKSGLDSGHLLENGVLSRFTYHNIVAAGLQTGELDWVSDFIHRYRNNLERSYRESSFSFNLARLAYSRCQYDSVLELLQKANYRDPLLNLAAKTLLLKTWYELGEYDLLQSHIDAMRNYLRRKRVIGYHRSNYLNIVRLADKLLNINWNRKKEVAQLRTEVEQEEILTEREWFLAQLG